MVNYRQIRHCKYLLWLFGCWEFTGWRYSELCVLWNRDDLLGFRYLGSSSAEKFRFRFRIQIGNRIQTVFKTVEKYFLKQNRAFLLLKANSCGSASGSTTLISTGGLFFCVYNFFVLDLTGGSSPCYDLHLVLLFLRGIKY
jgi:hypothetical protein